MLNHEQFATAYTNIKNSIVEHEQVFIEFLGGEPTISRAVRAAIITNTNPKFKFDITSNGSAELDWWHQASPNLNTISLAWHSLADTGHFLEVVNLLGSTKKEAQLPITVNAEPWPLKWARAVEVYETLKKQGRNVKFKILFANHNKGNNKFMDYSDDQMSYYFQENGIEVPAAAEEKPIEWVENQLYTDYKGHLCWAGVDQIVIDYFGYVYRGWCMVGSGYGNILEKAIKLDTSPKMCTRVLCKNGFDQQAHKSEKGWGL